jgi:hypothetical protein
MGLRSFIKDIFSVSREEEAELERLRAKHGIKPDLGNEKEENLSNKPGPDYDPWEDIRNARMHYFLGSWVTRKFRPIGEEKLKKDLAELEKKRQEEGELKKE